MAKSRSSKKSLRDEEKKGLPVFLSGLFLTVLLSALIYFFPSGLTISLCVIFAGIFFCLAVSYQREVMRMLILTLASLAVMGCFYFIAIS